MLQSLYNMDMLWPCLCLLVGNGSKGKHDITALVGISKAVTSDLAIVCTILIRKGTPAMET